MLECGWIKGLGRLFLQLLPLVLPINTSSLSCAPQENTVLPTYINPKQKLETDQAMSIEEHNWQKIINFDENFTAEAYKFENIHLGGTGQTGRNLCFDDRIVFGSIFVQIPLSEKNENGDTYFLLLQSHETQLLDKMVFFGEKLHENFQNVDEMQPLLHFFAGCDEKNMSEYKHIFELYEEHWNDGDEESIVEKQKLNWEQVQEMEKIYSQCYFTDGEKSKIEKLSTPNSFVFDCKHFFNNYTKFISSKEIEVKINPTTIDYTDVHDSKTMSNFKWFTSKDSGTVNFFVSSDTVITVYGLQIDWEMNADDNILTNDESFAKIKQTFERLKDDMDATSKMSYTFLRIFQCAAEEKSKDGILKKNMDIEVKKHASEVEKDEITVYHSNSTVPVRTMTWTDFQNAKHYTRTKFHCSFKLNEETMIEMRLLDFKNIQAFLNCDRPRKLQHSEHDAGTPESKRPRKTITVTALTQKVCKKCMVVD